MRRLSGVSFALVQLPRAITPSDDLKGVHSVIAANPERAWFSPSRLARYVIIFYLPQIT